MKTNGSADKKFSSNSSEKMPIENGSSTSLKALKNRLNNLPGRLPYGNRSITKDYYFSLQRFENCIEEKDEVEVGPGITKTCNFNKVTDNLNFIDARARRRAKLISSRVTSSDDEGLEPSSISTGPPSPRITKFYSQKKLKNHTQSSESESDYFYHKFNAENLDKKVKKYPVFLEPLNTSVRENKNNNLPFTKQNVLLNDKKIHTVFIPELDLQSEDQLSTSPEQLKKDSKRRDLDIDELVEALSQVSLSRSHRAEQSQANVKNIQTQSAPVSSREFRILDDPSRTFRISHQSPINHMTPLNFTNRSDNHKNIKKLKENPSSFDGEILTAKKSMTNLVQEEPKKIFVNTSTQLDSSSLSKLNCVHESQKNNKYRCPFTIRDQSKSPDENPKKIIDQKTKTPVALKKNHKVSKFSKLFTRKCKNKKMVPDFDASKVTKVLYENKNYVCNSSEDSGRSNSQSFGDKKIYDGNKIGGEDMKFSLAERNRKFRMDDQWVKNSTFYPEDNNRDPYDVFFVKNCREEKMISSREEEEEKDYLSLNEQKNSEFSFDHDSQSSLSRSSVTSNTFECKDRKKLKSGCFCFRFCNVLSRKTNL